MKCGTPNKNLHTVHWWTLLHVRAKKPSVLSVKPAVMSVNTNPIRKLLKSS
jgi:hypothetical protein